MERIVSVFESPFDRIQFVAIAIKAIDETQRHIGVLHVEGAERRVRLLDLAWHYVLRNDPPSPSYRWIELDLHPKRARHVAAICRKLWRSNGKAIPFGFSRPNDCFDEVTFRFVIGPTTHGLTCATFVLAVFQLAGLQLVDYNSWPKSRYGDIEWQCYVVDSLKRHGADANHIRAVEQEVGSVRFRPEEAAAAGTLPSSTWPLTFSAVELRAQAIVNQLSR